jgi:ferric-dicitrate binding protein FerR (iron transport regulator)
LLSPKRFLAIFLSSLMAALPALGEPQGAAQHAGQITAMIPAATRNSQGAKPNEELLWGDLLQTEHTGRLRANLADGSILSLGSDTQLHVVQHDASTQQTSLELTYGKVRSQVQKITQPGGKYEIKTPNAVIGVIGTHFLAEYDPGTITTTVTCYDGQVLVTPANGAQVQGQANSNSVTLNPGQTVQITNVIPPGGFHVSQVPPSKAQNGITSTDVPPAKEPRGANPGHVGPWVAVGYAVAVGLALGLTMGLNNGSHSGSTQKPTCQPSASVCP